ncbi:MAG TPA: hypothetical protein VFN30_10680 [Chitinophagaceae bacterium]|nr:hypothetical protein [Chitinophagaceae bacterium]
MNETIEKSDNELLQMIAEANDRALSGRLNRLRFLLSNEDDDVKPFSALAFEYYEEARLCWYVGAFVATIVMSQLALEETLRSYFRAANGVKGKLSSGKLVDSAGFADLINESLSLNIISKHEYKQLDKLRCKIRNPYVHPKDISLPKNESKSDFFRQHTKITAPELIGESVEDEASEAISILSNLLPEISSRIFGSKQK